MKMLEKIEMIEKNNNLSLTQRVCCRNILSKFFEFKNENNHFVVFSKNNLMIDVKTTQYVKNEFFDFEMKKN